MIPMASWMDGRTCLVTGANAGIGKATALGLAKLGAEVVMVCRDLDRGRVAAIDIRKATGSQSVTLLFGDLSSAASIRRVIRDFKKRHPRLHVLVNNAAILPRQRKVTEDGLELQFAVNHLAYFHLAHLLQDSLRAAAPSRIVNVASGAHASASLNLDDLQSEQSYSATRVYSKTKLLNVLFTHELARRLEGSGVTANSLHPGVIATGLLGNYLALPEALRFLTKLIFGSPERGARTSIHLASAGELESVTGKYFKDGKETASSPASHDREVQAALWKMSEELLGLAYTGEELRSAWDRYLADGQAAPLQTVIENEPRVAEECGHVFPYLHRLRDVDLNGQAYRALRCVLCQERLSFHSIAREHVRLDQSGDAADLRGAELLAWADGEARKNGLEQGPIDWEVLKK